MDLGSDRYLPPMTMSDILQPQSTSELENKKAALRRSKMLKRFFAWIAVAFICGAREFHGPPLLGLLCSSISERPRPLRISMTDGGQVAGELPTTMRRATPINVPLPIQNRNLSLHHRPVPQKEERPRPSRRALSCSSLAVSRSADWQSGDDGARSRRANHRRTDAISSLCQKYEPHKIWALLYPIAWVDDNHPADWFWHRLPERTAKFKHYVIGANWSVDEPQKWFGYGFSVIIDPEGKVLASAKSLYGSEIVYATIKTALGQHYFASAFDCSLKKSTHFCSVGRSHSCSYSMAIGPLKPFSLRMASMAAALLSPVPQGTSW